MAIFFPGRLLSSGRAGLLHPTCYRQLVTFVFSRLLAPSLTCTLHGPFMEPCEVPGVRERVPPATATGAQPHGSISHFYCPLGSVHQLYIYGANSTGPRLTQLRMVLGIFIFEL